LEKPPTRVPGLRTLMAHSWIATSRMSFFPYFKQADFKRYIRSGKTVRKVPFSSSTFSIGGFTAIDFFQDGSFYLLDMPGHCPGHMGALARVTSNPSTFILLAGDTFHNGGEIRPSPHLNEHYPIPPAILSSSHESISREYFFAPDDERDLSTLPTPILSVGEKFNFDPVRTRATQLKVGIFDSHEDVLIISAHDPSYGDFMDLFPASLNDWKQKGWKGRGVWQFGNVTNRGFVLKRFQEAKDEVSEAKVHDEL
jgi:glyoxylase-like metal-dependent hydrolase (beta-lactamase superfamily II)